MTIHTNNKKHVLVTGGAGYIGSVTVPMLLAQGHKVTVVDQFYFGEHTLPEHPELRKLRLDTRALQHHHFHGVDAVIDFAAMSNDPCGEAFADLTWEINHRTRVRTAKRAREAGVKHYILPSSCSVYGFQEGVVNEDSPANPLTTYAKANLAAELDTLPLSSSGFRVTVLRLATVFGLSPRMRLDLVVNAMTHSAWKNREIIVSGGGFQKRPLVHVRDVSLVLDKVLATPSVLPPGQIFNLGSSSQNYTINQVAELITENARHRISVYHNGPQDLRSYHVDFTRQEKTLKICSQHSVSSGSLKILNALQNGSFIPSASCYTLDWYNSSILQSYALPSSNL